MNLDYEKEYILENEYIKLRPMMAEDENLLLPFALTEPEIWKYSLVQAIGKDGLKNYIVLALKARSDKVQYPFVVIDKVKNVVAGCTRLYDIDIKNLSTQVGYTWYGRDFQGTGVNINCKYLLLKFIFETLKFERLQLMADSRNTRSIAAMLKIGCTHEGTLRQNYITADGTRRDSAIFSILKEDWKNSVKEKITELMEKRKLHV